MKINLEKVDYRYRGARENALTNITLSLEANKIYGLLGKNGVGKSTMLYLIAGLLKGNNKHRRHRDSAAPSGDTERCIYRDRGVFAA